jgi:hypothetical protein
MDDEAITNILSSWGAAAVNAGKNLPHDDLVRTLRFVPNLDVWAVAPDGQAMFGLVRDELVLTIGIRDGRVVAVKSRPLQGRKLLVGLSWGERQRTEAGATSCATRWSFMFEGEREAHDQWQHLTGMVVVDQLGNEVADDREKLARAISATAGWK